MKKYQHFNTAKYSSQAADVIGLSRRASPGSAGPTSGFVGANPSLVGPTSGFAGANRSPAGSASGFAGTNRSPVGSISGFVGANPSPVGLSHGASPGVDGHGRADVLDLSGRAGVSSSTMVTGQTWSHSTEQESALDLSRYSRQQDEALDLTKPSTQKTDSSFSVPTPPPKQGQGRPVHTLPTTRHSRSPAAQSYSLLQAALNSSQPNAGLVNGSGQSATDMLDARSLLFSGLQVGDTARGIKPFTSARPFPISMPHMSSNNGAIIQGGHKPIAITAPQPHHAPVNTRSPSVNDTTVSVTDANHSISSSCNQGYSVSPSSYSSAYPPRTVEMNKGLPQTNPQQVKGSYSVIERYMLQSPPEGFPAHLLTGGNVGIGTADNSGFSCTQCPKMFKTKAAMKLHMTVHKTSEERQYGCQVCQRRFLHRHHLVVHQRKHSGEKPFQCNACSKTFMAIFLLHKHLRKHARESGTVCEVSIEQLKQLQEQKLIQTGPQPLTYTNVPPVSQVDELSGVNNSVSNYTNKISSEQGGSNKCDKERKVGEVYGEVNRDANHAEVVLPTQSYGAGFHLDGRLIPQLPTTPKHNESGGEKSDPAERSVDIQNNGMEIEIVERVGDKVTLDSDSSLNNQTHPQTTQLNNDNHVSHASSEQMKGVDEIKAEEEVVNPFPEYTSDDEVELDFNTGELIVNKNRTILDDTESPLENVEIKDEAIAEVADLQKEQNDKVETVDSQKDKVETADSQKYKVEMVDSQKDKVETSDSHKEQNDQVETVSKSEELSNSIHVDTKVEQTIADNSESDTQSSNVRTSGVDEEISEKVEQVKEEVVNTDIETKAPISQTGLPIHAESVSAESMDTNKESDADNTANEPQTEVKHEPLNVALNVNDGNKGTVDDKDSSAHIVSLAENDKGYSDNTLVSVTASPKTNTVSDHTNIFQKMSESLDTIKIPPSETIKPRRGKKKSRKVKCEICSRMFHSNHYLLLHMAVHKVNPMLISLKKAKANQMKAMGFVNKANVTCEVCNKTFKFQKSLNSHMRVHSEKSIERKRYRKAFREFVSGGETPQGVAKKDKKSRKSAEYESHRNAIDKVQINITEVKQRLSVDSAILEAKERLSSDSVIADVSVKDDATKSVGKIADDPPIKIIVDADNVKRYVCYACDNTYTTKQKLRLHALIHKDNCFLCDICGKSFFRQLTLDKHLSTHTLPRPHICDVCKKSFIHRSSLMRHKAAHLKSTALNVKQQFADISFELKMRDTYTILREERLQQTHQQGPNSQISLGQLKHDPIDLSVRIKAEDGMPCLPPVLSPANTPNSAQLNTCNLSPPLITGDHMETDDMRDHKHRLEMIQSAKLSVKRKSRTESGCSESDAFSSDGNPKRSRKTRVYQTSCRMCKETFPNVVMLKSHMVVHNTVETHLYECHVCRHRFTQSCSLLRHLKTSCQENKMKCVPCNKTFHRKNTFEQHMRLHEGGPANLDGSFYDKRRDEAEIREERESDIENNNSAAATKLPAPATDVVITPLTVENVTLFDQANNDVKPEADGNESDSDARTYLYSEGEVHQDMSENEANTSGNNDLMVPQDLTKNNMTLNLLSAVCSDIRNAEQEEEIKRRELEEKQKELETIEILANLKRGAMQKSQPPSKPPMAVEQPHLPQAQSKPLHVNVSSPVVSHIPAPIPHVVAEQYGDPRRHKLAPTLPTSAPTLPTSSTRWEAPPSVPASMHMASTASHISNVPAPVQIHQTFTHHQPFKRSRQQTATQNKTPRPKKSKTAPKIPTVVHELSGNSYAHPANLPLLVEKIAASHTAAQQQSISVAREVALLEELAKNKPTSYPAIQERLSLLMKAQTTVPPPIMSPTSAVDVRPSFNVPQSAASLSRIPVPAPSLHHSISQSSTGGMSVSSAHSTKTSVHHPITKHDINNLQDLSVKGLAQNVAALSHVAQFIPGSVARSMMQGYSLSELASSRSPVKHHLPSTSTSQALASGSDTVAHSRSEAAISAMKSESEHRSAEIARAQFESRMHAGGGPNLPPLVQVYQCDLCSKVSYNKIDFHLHMVEHAKSSGIDVLSGRKQPLLGKPTQNNNSDKPLDFTQSSAAVSRKQTPITSSQSHTLDLSNIKTEHPYLPSVATSKPNTPDIGSNAGSQKIRHSPCKSEPGNMSPGGNASSLTSQSLSKSPSDHRVNAPGISPLAVDPRLSSPSTSTVASHPRVHSPDMSTLTSDRGLISPYSSTHASDQGLHSPSTSTLASEAGVNSPSMAPGNLDLLRQELRQKIFSRRKSQGLEDLKVEFKEPVPSEMSEEERLKLLYRRECNRQAAHRSRMRKKDLVDSLLERLGEMPNKNHKDRKDDQSTDDTAQK